MKRRLQLIIFCLLWSWLIPAGFTQQTGAIITKEINRDWQFRQNGIGQWLYCEVPGSVHTDLLRMNLISPPFFGLDEEKMQWIDKVDWEYRTTFLADESILEKERIELVFEGVDTYAEIYLNDRLFLSTDNMFRTYKAEVKGILKEGENHLLIHFKSPIMIGLENLRIYGFQLPADNDQSETGGIGGNRVSPYVRKAPYHFGWDWGPRLVTSGIWRPVKLIAWSDGRIEDVNIITENLSEKTAELTVKVELEVANEGDYFIRLKRDSIPRDGVPFKLTVGSNKVEIPVKIDNPKLWWPNGHGDQQQYHFMVDLLKDKEIIDSIEVSTGLRTVKLVQQPDPDRKGRSFYFEVNDKPVFAKGANYIPNDVFLDQVEPQKYEFMVRSAAEANMNMLRVWGGGIYENDLFYDLCDQYGIMVWQDFMFACAMYPGNDEFLENVRQEAINNVKRLRNHPCIVLWCGNNEIEAAWGPYEEKRGWGWKQRYSDEQREIIWKAYDTLFHQILPGVIKEEDSGRPYWHSSPSAGMGQLASYETTSGDMHYWGVWHGQHQLGDFRKYQARFMSEYGFQSFPEFSSVKRYAHPESFNIESPVMLAHQRSGIGNLRIRHYMEQDYIVPEDFELFLYVSQLLQAEAISLAISSHRCDMPYCMGSLYWQLNDCWPAASWSGIDYYGRWKALHYAAREAFKPVVLVMKESDRRLIDVRLKGYIVADELPAEKLKVEMKLVTFDGIVEWQVSQDVEMASQSTLFLDKKFEEILKKVNPATVVLVSELMKGDSPIDTDLHYFVKPKDMELLDPLITTDMAYVGDSIEISITSKNLAKNVFLCADSITDYFSDNFFDVLPGQTVVVSIPVTNTNIENLKALKVLHLFMTENQSE
jgi:beta-mannosidase